MRARGPPPLRGRVTPDGHQGRDTSLGLSRLRSTPGEPGSAGAEDRRSRHPKNGGFGTGSGVRVAEGMRLVFDGFELDLESCKLLRSGADVRLERRAFDLLCYLAANP